MWAELSEQNVIKASKQFWEQMLSMKLDPIGNGEAVRLGDRHVLGVVALSGVWNGQIEVRLSTRLAHEATAAMLMQPIEEVGDGDTLDATREIANMIAGVLKSSLPRPCAMTIPRASIETAAYQQRDRDLLAVPFRHAAGEMLVRIWEVDCVAERSDSEMLVQTESA
ncbi:MAG: chemotaxis protein CheX [Acidobacteriota bacterium]|nr:chemotaxis protein CheX [Acidobacteriota bacterium]